MLKRFISIMAVLLTVCTSFGLPCRAERISIGAAEPQYKQISKMNVSLDIKDGKLLCCGKANSKYSYTETTIKLTLQKRKKDTQSWVSVCSWSDTQEGKSYACVSKEKTAEKGYDYRLYLKCTIHSPEGVVYEASGKYSNIVSN